MHLVPEGAETNQITEFRLLGRASPPLGTQARSYRKSGTLALSLRVVRSGLGLSQVQGSLTAARFCLRHIAPTAQRQPNSYVVRNGGDQRTGFSCSQIMPNPNVCGSMGSVEILTELPISGEREEKHFGDDFRKSLCCHGPCNKSPKLCRHFLRLA